MSGFITPERLAARVAVKLNSGSFLQDLVEERRSFLGEYAGRVGRTHAGAGCQDVRQKNLGIVIQTLLLVPIFFSLYRVRVTGLERLKGLGLDRKTVVVFTGDHGEEFYEHGRSFHGQSVYGEQNNMPLVVWGPGVVPAGRTVDETVQTIDLMPTLLELSRLSAPAGIQGHSSKRGGTGPPPGSRGDGARKRGRREVTGSAGR